MYQLVAKNLLIIKSPFLGRSDLTYYYCIFVGPITSSATFKMKSSRATMGIEHSRRRVKEKRVDTVHYGNVDHVTEQLLFNN